MDPRTLMLYSGQNLSGLHYSVTSQDVRAQPEQQWSSAGAVQSEQHEQLPQRAAGRTDWLITLAEQDHPGPRHRVTTRRVALQGWFTDSGQFTYSLNVEQAGPARGADQFLTTQRRGYCQQFAFAMAVLARLLGIPSRVAVGYTAGTSHAVHDRWLVKTSDAHAWPELYFQRPGWLRFEPTPAGAGGQATAIQPAYTRRRCSTRRPGRRRSRPPGPPPRSRARARPAPARWPSWARSPVRSAWAAR